MDSLNPGTSGDRKSAPAYPDSIFPPVWARYSTNTNIQEQNKGTIDEENRRIAEDSRRVAEDRKSQARAPKWEAGVGTVKRGDEEFDANDFLDHPEVGPVAEKSLFRKDLEDTKADVAQRKHFLSNPDRPKRLSEEQRATLEMQGKYRAIELSKAGNKDFESDLDYAKLKKQLVDDSAVGEEELEHKRAIYDGTSRAIELMRMEKTGDLSAWRQSRQPKPTLEDAVATHQAVKDRGAELDQRTQDIAAQEAQMAKPMKGADLAASAPQREATARDREQLAADKVAHAAEKDQAASEVSGQARKTADAMDKKSTADPTLRGLGVSAAQIPQLAYGTVGLIGKTAEDLTGFGKGLKEWGLRKYSESEKSAAPLSSENDSLTTAWGKLTQNGDVGAMVDFTRYAVGYGVGQALESVAVAGLGGLIGGAATAETGPGAAVGAAGGAITGVVARGAVMTFAKGLIEKAIAKEALSLAAKEAEKMAVKTGVEITTEQIAKRAATGEMRKAAGKEIGSSIALVMNGNMMELGSIYPEAEKQAASEGRQMDRGDIARVWLAGLGAGAVEGMADKFGVDILKGKFGDAIAKTGITGRLGAAAVGGLADAGVEGTTEAIQTGIERFGARQSLTDAEAKRDYVDSAGMGAFSGGVMGGAGAAWSHEAPTADPLARVNAEILAQNPDATPATRDEFTAARAMVGHAPADIAEGVGIHREISAVEVTGEQTLADAEAQLQDATAAGDKGAVAAAEESVKKARGAAAIGSRVRGALKIARGEDISTLTDAEMRSLGVTRDGDSIATMKPSDLEAEGLTKPLLDVGDDGSPVILDEVLAEIRTVSPTAAARVKLTETEARQAATARSLSTATPNDTQGDPAVGSDLPSETKGAVEFTVTGKKGTTLQVMANTLEEANSIAVSHPSWPMGEQVATTVSHEPNPQSTQPESASVAPVQVPPVSTGTPGIANSVPAGGKPAGVGPAQAQAEAPVAKTILRHVTRLRKNPKLAAAIRISEDPADRAKATDDGKITVNLKALAAEAEKNGLSGKQAQTWIADVIDEEIRHLAQFEAARSLWDGKGDFKAWRAAHYAAILKEFSSKEVAAMRDLYGHVAFDALEPWAQAFECLRMVSQKLAKGNPSEVSRLIAGRSAAFIAHLRAALKVLKDFVAGIQASPALSAEIAAIEAALSTYESSKPDPSNRSEKQPTHEAAPEAVRETGGDPQPAIDGPDVPAGRGAVLPADAPRRVTWQRGGESLSGVVLKENEGIALVKLDKKDRNGIPTAHVKIADLTFEASSDTKPTEKPASQATAGKTSDTKRNETKTTTRAEAEIPDIENSAADAVVPTESGGVGADVQPDDSTAGPQSGASQTVVINETPSAKPAPAAEAKPAGEVIPEAPVVETPVEAAAEVKGEMVNPQNRRPAKEIKAEIIQRVEEEIAKLPDLGTDWPTDTLPMKASLEGQHFRDIKQPEFATIKIPGDGTFRIRRTTKDLTELLSRVKRMSITDRETKPSTRFFTSTITGDMPEEAISRKDSILLGLQEPDYRKKLAKRLGEEKLTKLEDMLLQQEGVTRAELNGEAQAPVEEAPTADPAAPAEAKPATTASILDEFGIANLPGVGKLVVSKQGEMWVGFIDQKAEVSFPDRKDTVEALATLADYRKSRNDKEKPKRAPRTGLSAAPLSDGQSNLEASDSPANVFGTTYQPVPFSQLTSWQIGALRTAEQIAGRGKVHIVRLALEDTAGSGSASRFQAALFSLFRKRIAFVRGIGKAFRDDGMVSTDDLNTILIDADSRQGVSYLVGHEVGHSIQHQRPDLYAKLSKTILDLASEWGDYNDRLKEIPDYEKDQETRNAEFVNDFIGSQFGEPKFWRKLYSSNRPVFRELVDSALKYLKAMGGKIHGMSRDVRPYFKDIESARNMLVETLEQYQRGEMPDVSVGKELKGATDAELTGLEAAPLHSSDDEYLSLAKDPDRNRESLQKMAETPDRHAELEAKHNAGTITPAETAEAQAIVDAAAKAAGYDLSHREGVGVNWATKKNVVQFADWNPATQNRNDHYGEANYVIKSSDLKPVPEFVVEWVAENDPDIQAYAEMNGEDPLKIARESLNPKDIVGGADFWDNREAVSRLWGKFEDELGVGYLTPDGAVIFDPFTASEMGMAKLTDPFTGVPLAQRFNPASNSILYAAPLHSSDDEYLSLAKDPDRNRESLQKMAETPDRHAELEAKHNAGTITPAETAEAQAMVDEKAKSSKGVTEAVHGGVAGITSFDANKIKTQDGGAGFYFSTAIHSGHAENYAKKIDGKTYRVFLTHRNPYYSPTAYTNTPSNDKNVWKPTLESIRNLYGLTDKEVAIFVDHFDGLTLNLLANPHEFAYRLSRLGSREVFASFSNKVQAGIITMRKTLQGEYGAQAKLDLIGFLTKHDGIIYKDGDVATALHPSQIKSADPFTGVPLAQRFNSSSNSILYAAPLADAAQEERAKADLDSKKPLVDEAKKQMEVFGSGSMGLDGKHANPGSTQKARDTFDITRAVDSATRTTRSDADTHAKGREFLAKYPEEVERLLFANGYGESREGIADYQQYAIKLYLDQIANNASSDEDLNRVYMASFADIISGREMARAFRQRHDLYQTPSERAMSQINDRIFVPSKEIERRAAILPPSQRKDFIGKVGEKRIAEVRKQLEKQLGLRLEKVVGKNRELQLANSKMMKEILKLRDRVEGGIIKMVQHGYTLKDIERRWKVDPTQAQAIVDKARADLAAKLKIMLASGMTRDEIRESMKDGLKAAGLGGDAKAMSPDDIDALVESMLADDFGLPKVVPPKPLPKLKNQPGKLTKEQKAAANPLNADWSKPIFTDGLKEFTFDTKDRSDIMNLVETVRALASGVGTIKGLEGPKLAVAQKAMDRINAILKKYGTDAQGIFEAGTPIENYGFDPSDVAQVAAIVRVINGIDADWIDKGVELAYANMLSGFQTSAVNATAGFHVAWKGTIGRAFDLVLNSFINDPMAAQWGEMKYVLRALKPAWSRAISNMIATWKSQHPMFERDVLGMDVDWDAHMGGALNHTHGGVISGKKGNIVRIPTRILSAVDDLYKSFGTCAETAAYAYRLGLVEAKNPGSKYFGMKPDDAKFQKFLRVQCNTPGSLASKLAAEKTAAAIFANALPGQKNYLGETASSEGIGGKIGLGAKALNEFVSSREHKNMVDKLMMALLRMSLFPFQRVPFQIVRQGARYVPNPISIFDIVSGAVGNSVGKNPSTGKMEFGWDLKGNRADLLERVGQQLQGATLMLLLAAIGAGEGDEGDDEKFFLMTGSQPWTPYKRAELDARRRAGVEGYRISFRRKDGSEIAGLSYGRLEPFATVGSSIIDTMSAIKRGARAGQDVSGVAANMVGSLAAQAQNKTFLQGIGDLIDIVQNMTASDDVKEPTSRKVNQFLAGRVAMAVPNLFRQPIREADNNYRERSDSLMQEILYQAVPYGQKPAKIDPYGKEETKRGNAVLRTIDVFDAGAKNDVNPVDRMLIKWRDSGKWSKAVDPDNRKPWFPQPILKASYPDPKTGKSVEMNPAQLQEFRQKSGELLAGALKSQRLNFENPTELDISKVRDTMRKAREVTKKGLSYKFAKEVTASPPSHVP